ncbi:hypothetical protein NPIL_1221, partial [Nephila pilipes]
LKKAEQKLEKQKRIISSLEGKKSFQLLNDIKDSTKKENRDQLKKKIVMFEGYVNELSQFQNSLSEEINNQKKNW